MREWLAFAFGSHLHPGNKPRCHSVTWDSRSAKRHSSTYMELVSHTQIMQRLDIPFCLGKSRFNAIKVNCLQNGLSTRVHGNTRRLPHNSLTFFEIRNVVRFLQSYADLHAILLPGRIPGYKRDDLALLPSSTTKMVLNTRAHTIV